VAQLREEPASIFAREEMLERTKRGNIADYVWSGLGKVVI
jgi:hypothetical protein